MTLRGWFAALTLFIGSTALAQEHAQPENMGLGIPGPQLRSFVIAWHPVPGAVAYEYVLSDNFLCFAGCVGDTREAVVSDTFALERELLPDKQYYWITRAHFADSLGPWSLISWFWSYTPLPSPLVQVVPNPVEGQMMMVQVDWAGNELADQVAVSVVDQQGKTVAGPWQWAPVSGVSRLETRELDKSQLPPGLYFLVSEASSRSGLTFRKSVQKVLIQR